MNENSKLIPSKITVQSNAAITILKLDIEHLEQAKKATNAFINDDSNNTSALKNLKSKMQNYQLAIDAFIRAKDLAIKDHQTLINLVSGVPPLVGSVILQQIQDKKHDRSFYEGRIEHYKQVQNNTNLWNSINPFDWTHSNAGRNLSRSEGLLDNTNEIIANYEQKIETYYEIEQATKELFVESNELISKTKLGIGHIGEASAGLPSSFHTRALGAWRVDILETKEIELEILVTLETLREIPPDGFLWEQQRKNGNKI